MYKQSTVGSMDGFVSFVIADPGRSAHLFYRVLRDLLQICQHIRYKNRPIYALNNYFYRTSLRGHFFLSRYRRIQGVRER
jgi:hypothetical protein